MQSLIKSLRTVLFLIFCGVVQLQAAVTATSLAIVGYDDYRDSFSVMALDNLAAGEVIYFTNNGWSSTVRRTHMAQILRNLPGTPVQHRLAAVRFALPNQLSTADEIQFRTDYQNEIAWSGGLSADDKENIAAYLQAQSEHALVTTLISDREALTEPKLFSRRFDSLLELGNWREAGAMNAAHEAPMLPHSRALAQALATLQNRMSRNYAVEVILNEALTASQRENRALDCYATGCAALDHTLPNLAATAFATALDISTDRAKTMQAIVRSARQGQAAARNVHAFSHRQPSDAG
ncbi:MAG: hypothetical protein JWR15_2418 [Prosthecobacter sp.]|nr:hypothetical protein [Prosthecobacter sp.]